MDNFRARTPEPFASYLLSYKDTERNRTDTKRKREKKMKIKVEIQMAYADCFQAIVDKKEFERKLQNVDLGNTTLVPIFDNIKNTEVFFNPKHVAYIRFFDGMEDAIQ